MPIVALGDHNVEVIKMPGERALTFFGGTFDDEVLAAEIPVLVDIWADGGEARQRIAPLIEVNGHRVHRHSKGWKTERDDEHSHRDEVQHPYCADRIGVQRFKGGKVLEQRVGVNQEADLRAMLDCHLRAHS